MILLLSIKAQLCTRSECKTFQPRRPSEQYNLQPSIQFTCEVEEDGKLPFLDIQLVGNGSSLETSVYGKKTHTDRYLHYNSHHHPRVKVGIVKTLKDRASRIVKVVS